MSYIFYCSRCKKDHAGECQPEKTLFSLKIDDCSDKIQQFQKLMDKYINELMSQTHVGKAD